MVDGNILQGVKSVLDRINSLKNDDNLEVLLNEYGVDIRILSEDEIVREIVNNLLTSEEAYCYKQYMIYKKGQDYNRVALAIDSLNTLTSEVDSLYTERKEASSKMIYIGEIVSKIKRKLIDVPTIRISTLYNHVSNDYDRYCKTAINAGMEESRLSDRINSMQRTSFLIRGMRTKELNTLKKELEEFKNKSALEIEERKERYERSSEEYQEFLIRVLEDLLRDDMILNSILLSINSMYDVDLTLEEDYKGVSKVSNNDKKEFSKSLIVKYFFNYFEEHNNGLEDVETFKRLLEDFILYFYNNTLRILDGTKDRCLRDISSLFIKQKALIGDIADTHRNLSSEIPMDKDEEDTMALVYSLYNPKK